VPTTTEVRAHGPATATGLLALVEPFGPAAEGDALVFDLDPPADLEPALRVLHTGIRAALTGRRWYGWATPARPRGRARSTHPRRSRRVSPCSPSRGMSAGTVSTRPRVSICRDCSPGRNLKNDHRDNHPPLEWHGDRHRPHRASGHRPVRRAVAGCKLPSTSSRRRGSCSSFGAVG
jgi:hypothetical protein